MSMMKTIELKKIICEDNRKYTKDEGFEQLVNSIKEYSVIEPPVVREQEDGNYKIIAGRRRIAAVTKLAKSDHTTLVNCIVVEADDPRSDDEIALAENVNRHAMHPLDEASLFFTMECKGLPVKEIAKSFARSPQDIYKRLRLMRLTDDLKKLFRDGWMTIEAAAIIAELPEDDQTDFFDEYDYLWDVHKNELPDKCRHIVVSENEAASYVQKKQKYKIKPLMKGCKDCKKRTHNTDNELFTDVAEYDDVCLDADCYRKKWKESIEKELDDYIKANKQVNTDRMIFFERGIPADIYKQAKFVQFDLDSLQEPDAKFEVVKPNKYEFTHGETDRKKDCCYRIKEHGDGQITVERIGYKIKEKVKAQEEKEESKPSNEKKKDGNAVEAYGKETMKAIAEKRGVKPQELAEELESGGVNKIYFKSNILEELKEIIIKRRIEAESKGTGTQINYFEFFLRVADREIQGNWLDKCLNKEEKKLLIDITGCESLAQIAENISPTTQKIFHFMFLNVVQECYEDCPDVEELNKLKSGDNIWFDYSGMTKEEYRALYLQVAEEIINKKLGKPKPKAELVKKEKPAKKKKAAADNMTIKEWVNAGTSEDEYDKVLEAADKAASEDPEMGTDIDEEDYDEDPSL